VSDVREPGASGLEFVDESEGLFDGLMHGMRNIAEGVDDEVVEVFEERHGGFRKAAEIGEISGAAKAKPRTSISPWRRGTGMMECKKLEGAFDFVEDHAERC